MRNLWKRTIRGISFLVVFFVVVVGLYLGAALLAARTSATPDDLIAAPLRGLETTVFLATSPLHADILIPATPVVLKRFSFLRDTAIPLDHPDLRYLSFGWGSRAFYTTAGSYSDITVSAVAQAVVGDDAVMRIVGFGAVDRADDMIEKALNPSQLDALLTYIEQSFSEGANGLPLHMANASIGQGDAFYEARGDFNIFNPCNQWVNYGLRKAGIQIGWWTPTTQSLRHSLIYHGEILAGPQPSQP